MLDFGDVSGSVPAGLATSTHVGPQQRRAVPPCEPPYAEISIKYERLPPLIAEDLGLRESFVHPSTHNHPLSQNHPRKTTAKQQNM
jgi:hypothetical protein